MVSAYVFVWADSTPTGDRYAKAVYDYNNVLAAVNGYEFSRILIKDGNERYFEWPVQLQCPADAWVDKQTSDGLAQLDGKRAAGYTLLL